MSSNEPYWTFEIEEEAESRGKRLDARNFSLSDTTLPANTTLPADNTLVVKYLPAQPPT